MYFIYEIKNIINNKRYIGYTKDIEVRKKRHFKELHANKHHSILLQRAYNKYGPDCWEFNIITTFIEKDCALAWEYILINDDFDNNYNTSRVAEGGDKISYHPNRENIVSSIRKAVVQRFKNMSKEDKELWDKKFQGVNNSNYKTGYFMKSNILKRQQELEDKRKSLGLRSKQSISKLGETPSNITDRGRNLVNKLNSLKKTINNKPIYCESYLFRDIEYAEYVYKRSLILGVLNEDNIKYFDFRVATKEDIIKYEYFNIDIHTIKVKPLGYYSSKAIVYKNIIFNSIIELSKVIGYSQDYIITHLDEDFRYALYEDGCRCEWYDKTKHSFTKKPIRHYYCNGLEFKSSVEAGEYFKVSHKTILNRCKSKLEIWKDYYYIDK